MDIIKKINLDFSVPMAPEIIRVRRGDTARILEFHLFNGGLELNISAGATATLAVTKPSGVKLKKTVTTERENNVVSVALTSEMTNELGRCHATLEVTDNLTAASNVFTVLVEDNPAYEAAESGSAVLQEKTVAANHSEKIVTPDPGYDGLSKVTVEAIPTAERATPTVTIDQSTGKITARSVQGAGYVTAGTKTGTLQLPTVAGQTVKPGAAKKLVAEAGTYATGDIYVDADASSGYAIQGEKTIGITSNSSGVITPSVINPDTGYTAIERVNLYFTGGSLNAAKIKKGEAILGVTGTYEAGGGASIETVAVTIVGNERIVSDMEISYTGLDDSGNPILKDVMIGSDWQTDSIDVVKNTTLVIYDGTGDYQIGCDSQSGLKGFYEDGAVLICDVGDVACSITPSQIELTGDSTAEDLSAELATQKQLISDIKTALAGKAAGGGTEPTLVEVKGYNLSGNNFDVYYTTYENGTVVGKRLTMASADEVTLYCVDGTTLLLYFTEIQLSCDAYSGALDYINDDETFFAFVVDSDGTNNSAAFDFS